MCSSHFVVFFISRSLFLNSLCSSLCTPPGSFWLNEPVLLFVLTMRPSQVICASLFAACVGNETFACNDGRCIPRSWRCDGDIDCKNEEDEKNCTSEYSVFVCRIFSDDFLSSKHVSLVFRGLARVKIKA